MSPLHRVLIGLGSAGQLVRRADRARDRKAYAKAAKFYTLALTLHPERTDLALAQAPEDGDIHLQLGHLLKLTGRTEEAVAAYRDAERLPPDGRAAAAELAALVMVSPEEASDAHIRDGDRMRDAGDSPGRRQPMEER